MQSREERDTGFPRPVSTVYPAADCRTFKPLQFDMNKERMLPHPSALHSINMPSRVPVISPFLIDSLLKSDLASDRLPPHKHNDSSSDDSTLIKKIKITTPTSIQTPILPTDQVLTHYLLPNTIPLTALYPAHILPSIQQIATTSSTQNAVDQKTNPLDLAIPMCYTSSALSRAGIQLVSVDPNTGGYYAIHQGSLVNGNLINDS